MLKLRKKLIQWSPHGGHGPHVTSMYSGLESHGIYSGHGRHDIQSVAMGHMAYAADMRYMAYAVGTTVTII